MPSAGFYLWPKTPIDDAFFARELYAKENLTVLPGVLSRAKQIKVIQENRGLGWRLYQVSATVLMPLNASNDSP